MENKEYVITTIEDYMNVVTEENHEMLIGNFYGITLQWLKMKESSPDIKFKNFKWIDDGIIEIRKPECFVIEIDK